MWKYFTDLFDYLPLTALVDNQVRKYLLHYNAEELYKCMFCLNLQYACELYVQYIAYTHII